MPTISFPSSTHTNYVSLRATSDQRSYKHDCRANINDMIHDRIAFIIELLIIPNKPLTPYNIVMAFLKELYLIAEIIRADGSAADAKIGMRQLVSTYADSFGIKPGYISQHIENLVAIFSNKERKWWEPGWDQDINRGGAKFAGALHVTINFMITQEYFNLEGKDADLDMLIVETMNYIKENLIDEASYRYVQNISINPIYSSQNSNIFDLHIQLGREDGTMGLNHIFKIENIQLDHNVQIRQNNFRMQPYQYSSTRNSARERIELHEIKITINKEVDQIRKEIRESYLEGELDLSGKLKVLARQNNNRYIDISFYFSGYHYKTINLSENELTSNKITNLFYACKNNTIVEKLILNGNSLLKSIQFVIKVACLQDGLQELHIINTAIGDKINHNQIDDIEKNVIRQLIDKGIKIYTKADGTELQLNSFET